MCFTSLTGVVNRYKDVCFREIGSNASLSDGIWNSKPALNCPWYFTISTGDVYHLFRSNISLIHIITVHKEHATFIFNTPVTVVQTKDGSIELIMTANCHQQEFTFSRYCSFQRINAEMGFAVTCVKNAGS